MIDDLVLHARSAQLIKKTARNLPHGLIIEGPTGVGVTETARAIANEIDALYFELLPKKKIKNESVIDMNDGSIIIDDIRELYEKTRTRQTKKHIYIIDTGAKSMTHAAQNAFLKLLEEPRDNVHFIIATHRFDLLLPTIVSRCLHIALLSVSQQQTKDIVRSLAITDATKAARLEFVGRGLPALIMRLAGDDQLYAARVAIMQDAKVLLSGSADEKLPIIQKYRDNRPDTITLLDDMNYQLRTILNSRSDTRIVKDIDHYLRTRDSVAAGANIRLQLAGAVL